MTDHNYYLHDAVHILRSNGTVDHADACAWAVGEIARLREALTATLRETEEHYCDIVGARDALFQSNVPPRVAAAYREELARMGDVIAHARAALAAPTDQVTEQEK